MTRIEVLEEIIKQNGNCNNINCYEDKCPLGKKFGNGSCGNDEEDLKTAKEMLEKEKNKEKPKFEVGDDVEATNNKLYWTSKGMYKFYSYDETLYNPYLVKYVSEDGNTFVTSFKYCRKVQPKYKAYTEFNVEWLGEKIYNIDEYEWQIVGRKDGKVLLYGDYDYKTVSLEDLVKEYTKDSIPFGEEIK